MARSTASTRQSEALCACSCVLTRTACYDSCSSASSPAEFVTEVACSGREHLQEAAVAAGKSHPTVLYGHHSLLSNVGGKVHVPHTQLLHCGPMQMQVVQVPNRGIWGTAGIDGANIDRGIANDGDYRRVGQGGWWGPLP